MSRLSFSRTVARRSGSNFYASFFFLPPSRREALMTVYAFSRIVDDSVDETADASEAEKEIQLWRRRIHLGSNGNLFHPLLPELLEVIGRYDLPKNYFLDLLTGVEMDLNKKRYETFSELETYCYHVAGVVGLLCNRLFGLPGEEAKRYAILLGTAFQLTNILRDVGGDARRGRIYIPREDLRRFAVAESDLLDGIGGPRFLELMHFEADRAEEFFRRAFQALPDPKRQRILPAAIMTSFYQALLEKLRAEDFPVFKRKVSLSRLRKFRLVAGTLAEAVQSLW